MDSNSHFQLQENQSNSGLPRFRSAPSHVLSNLKRGEPERVVLRFMNSSEKDSPSSLREFVDINNKPSASKSPSPLSRMNSQQGNGSSSFSHSQYQRHSSVGMDQPRKSFNSNLLRQSSFPAGAGNFSNNISFQNGYDSMKGVGNYGGVNGSDGELSLSMNRLKNQINFSSREGIGAIQLNGELGNQIHHTLSPHLSLPRESSEIFAMEMNMLHLPDSVPCKIRAKRGFATHPRSIAERVRRTRISERIRKLQELVPNMDKQTSIAEMLDLAAGYINDLQKQYKTLSEKRARCKCISMKKLETNQVS